MLRYHFTVCMFKSSDVRMWDLLLASLDLVGSSPVHASGLHGICDEFTTVHICHECSIYVRLAQVYLWKSTTTIKPKKETTSISTQKSILYENYVIINCNELQLQNAQHHNMIQGFRRIQDVMRV